MIKPRIIIEVEGGLVRWVHSNVEIDVDILDIDTEESDLGEEEVNRMNRLKDEAETLPHVY